MELRPRPRVSGPRTKPRATSLGRGVAGEQENSSVAREALVDVPSLAMMTTSGSGDLSPRVFPVQGGGARSFAPLARSESAGEAIRPPKGYPYRRSGSSLQIRDETLKRCDAGGVGTIALRPTADMAVIGGIWPKGLQPSSQTTTRAALVWRLMVSTTVNHVITRITTHLPTPMGWKADLACFVDP